MCYVQVEVGWFQNWSTWIDKTIVDFYEEMMSAQCEDVEIVGYDAV